MRPFYVRLLSDTYIGYDWLWRKEYSMISIEHIKIKELVRTDLKPDLLEDFNRYQEVNYVWRRKDGKKVLVKNPFIDNWDSELKRDIVAEDFSNCMNGGGIVYGAFHNDKLIAFASLPYYFFGSQKQYVQLMQLHVSNEYRGLGLGKRLFLMSADKAKEWGAKKLYISGHSCQETQSFYEGMGCVDAVEINSRIAQHEPFDCQLEFLL